MDRGAWQAYSPWGCKELDTTEHTHTYTHRQGPYNLCWTCCNCSTLPHSTEAVINNRKINRGGCVPVKFYLQNRHPSTGHNLPTPILNHQRLDLQNTCLTSKFKMWSLWFRGEGFPLRHKSNKLPVTTFT